jgi:hypothetical protein
MVASNSQKIRPIGQSNETMKSRRQGDSEESHLADDRRISDDGILVIERGFAVQWGGFEVLFPELRDVHIWDLTDSQERAVSRVNVFMHDGIAHQALFSAKERSNSLCKDEILKIRVPEGLFSSSSVTSFRDDFHGASES